MAWLRWVRWLRDLLGWVGDGSADSLVRAAANVLAESRNVDLPDTHPLRLAIDGCHAETDRLRDLLKGRR